MSDLKSRHELLSMLALLNRESFKIKLLSILLKEVQYQLKLRYRIGMVH